MTGGSEPSDDDDLLAAEFAAGLLSSAESDAAETRATRDASFARRIELWRDHFVRLFDGTEQTPPAHLWPLISRRLSGVEEMRLLRQKLRIWQSVAVAAIAAIFVLAFLQAGNLGTDFRSPPSAASSSVLVASLHATQGRERLAVRFDVAARRLVSAPAPEQSGQESLELWVIPSDGTPRSLGLISTTQIAELSPPAGALDALAVGATLAVSREPRGGSSTGLPTGPIVLQGELEPSKL